VIQKIELSKLSPNTGQVEGLPANPRQLNDAKFEKLKKSLQDDPEMLELRELLVFFYNGEYVVIAGNMRYRAAMELGIKSLPCKIIPPETPVAKLKAYTIKDNSTYGEWDYDMLANEWDAEDLDDWGVDIWQNNPEDYSNKNKEYTADDFSNVKCFFKLEYSEQDYQLLTEKIKDSGKTAEQIFYDALV